MTESPLPLEGMPFEVPVGNAVAPGSVAEAQRMMQAAASDGRVLAFLGGGTEIGFGNPPERIDTVVQTTRMQAVVEYVPSDLIVTVEAGMTLAALQQLLAPERQRLALDAPFPERATIGGLLATNAFGPRRARFGTLRDLIVGISFVRADGTLARGGGKVVKNVAGFDLPKLMVGALGSLGLIATATFRLHPVPETSRWLRTVVPSASAVRELCAALVDRRLEPSAVVALRRNAAFEFCILFEGFPAGVDDQCAAFEALLAQRALASEEISGDIVARADEATRGGAPVRMRLAAPPAEFEQLVDEALVPLERAFPESRAVCYPTAGIAFVAGTPGEEGRSVRAVLDARVALEERGGNLVVTHVEAKTFAGPLDRFGVLPPSFFLMKQLKERFDPQRRLNRGRFLGGL